MIRTWSPMLVVLFLVAACDGAVEVPSATSQADGGVPVSIPTTAPVAGTELCDGYDNDLDGEVDEGCACSAGATGDCYPGLPGKAGIGICKHGTHLCVGESEFAQWGACEGAIAPMPEVCGNGIDEDCDGSDLACGSTVPPNLPSPDAAPPKPKADAGAPPPQPPPPQPPPPPPPATECTAGQTQSCYSGPAGTAGVGSCKAGKRTCSSAGSWGACSGELKPASEVCGNSADEDCDGKASACPPLKLPLFFLGDCVTASCPASHPHPVGCQVIFSPGDARGCVANAPGSSIVYFQAGDQCDKGLVTGFLLCDTKPGNGLNLFNCPMIGKTKFYYPASPAGCPPVH